MGKKNNVRDDFFAEPSPFEETGQRHSISGIREKLWGRAATLAVLCLLAAPAGAMGQALNSNSPTIVLTATLPETLTVAATPTAANFTLVPGGTSNANTIAITTSTVLMGSRTSLILVGYFASAAAALSTSAPVSSTTPS